MLNFEKTDLSITYLIGLNHLVSIQILRITNTNTNTITNTNTYTTIQPTYDLDSHRELKLFNLLFHDTYSTLIVSRIKLPTVEICLKTIEDLITALESTTSKGFLQTHDLRKFPIVSEIIHSFILNPANNEYLTGEKTMESYKWIYNIVLLNLYLLTLEVIHAYDTSDTTNIEDLVLDLKSKSVELYGKLDPSIRHHIQKRGIGVKQNTYIGFDTEFTSKDLDRNNLVSGQIAITTKTYVQIPRTNPYSISLLDESSNKLFKLNKNSTYFNYPKVENSIQLCINSIRKLKYADYDASMYVLGESLKLIRGVNYVEQPDQTVFSLPRSIIETYIHIGNSFSFNELIQISSAKAKPHHNQTYSVLLSLIRDITSNNFTIQAGNLEETILLKYEGYNGITELGRGFEESLSIVQSEKDEIEKDVIEKDVIEKRVTRQFYTDLFKEKVSVTKTKCYYIIAHLTPADLSMLSDFDEIKEDLSIVNGSFVTLGQPFKFQGRNIHIRDTMLLAPGGSKSLANIGKLYGGVLNKISISQEDLEDMHGFLNRDRDKFIEYALRDAMISLIHACWMEDFNFQLGVIGIPLSLSSIGRKYVKMKWGEESYPGYQISNKYLLGDAATTITPKGLNEINKIGFVLPYYIANYKGGRNECFMFGVDRDKVWYDYDLISAYTTVMSMAGSPEYDKCKRITIQELQKMSKEEILFSYLILYADFEFPLGTKYPSIPCYVDESCTVYPLSGSCVLTGAEYLLASSQKCKLKIYEIYITPFINSEGKGNKENKPFSSILKLVQEQRREHAKGTISNLMYKEIGNSIYGSVVRGIGNKRKFDTKSKGTVRVLGDDLTNPLIASWTTAFIRSIVGECLQSIQNVGGLVVSVTTDGFITNVSDLEIKLLNNYLFGEFKKIRTTLSSDCTGLEIKSEGKGVIAWSTRGQIGIESKIIATTGFQHGVYGNKTELLGGLIATVKSENKTLEFIQRRLRSATDIYKKGGNVTMHSRDQLFRMHFDNRRVLEWETTIPATIEGLSDSKPLTNVNQGKNLRFIAKLSKNKQYGKYTGVAKIVSKYNNRDEIAVRNFLKGLLSTPPKFNLNREEFKTYQSIVDFIKEYNPKIIVTRDSLGSLNNRVKNLKCLPVNRSETSEAFISYVKEKFKDFDEESFFRQN